MADDLDPSAAGNFRWAFTKTRERLNRFVWSCVVVALIALVVGASFTPLQTPSWSQRVWFGLASALLIIGGVVVLAFLVSLFRAPYEQVSALRGEIVDIRGTPATVSPQDRIAALVGDQKNLLTRFEAGQVPVYDFERELDGARQDAHVLVAEVSPERRTLLDSWQPHVDSYEPGPNPQPAVIMRQARLRAFRNQIAALEEIALRMRAEAGADEVGPATYRRVRLQDYLLAASHEGAEMGHREASTEEILAWERDVSALMQAAVPSLESERVETRESIKPGSLAIGSIDWAALPNLAATASASQRAATMPIDESLINVDFHPQEQKWEGRWTR